tara:strand:+ start:145 stop:1134 length:990 start_codon:yes stop_codon:yes gene_type:complete
MRNLISLFLSSAFLFSCTKEFVPPEDTEADTNLLAIIAPSGNPDHKTGSVQASFLSSNSVFTVASSTLSNLEFPVTFISTAENNDSIVWIFEGSTASPTTLRGNASSPSAVATQVFYQKLGSFDVVHAVANKTDFNVIRKKNYVSYEFRDNLTIDATNDDSWTVLSAEPIGWIAPADTYVYAPCEESLVAFHTLRNPDTGEVLDTNNDNHTLSKSFRSFGDEPKNLVFEYKIDFIALPTVVDINPKISLSYNPIIALGSGLNPVETDPYELWSDVTYEVTRFRQVIIPLPNLSDFDLVFTKYPSTLNENDDQLHPFTVCIRDIRIVASE